MRIHLYILLLITVNLMLIHARVHARTLHIHQRARADVRKECPCISHRSRLAVRQGGAYWVTVAKYVLRTAPDH